MTALRPRSTRLIAVSAVLALGLAACGGDDDTADDPAAPEPGEIETEDEEPADDPTDDEADTGEDDGADETNGDDSVAEGDSDGQLVVYSGRDEGLVQPIIDQFETATGIDVDVRYAGTAELAALILEEGDNSPAEVFFGQDAGALGALASSGVLQPLPQETLELVPEIYRASDDTWVGLTGRSRVLIYSDASVDPAELPASIFELTEEQWQGRVGIAPTNASFQAFVTALRVQHGEDVAQQWLEDLAANDPVIFEGNGGIVTDVDEDALDVGLVNHYYIWAKAAELGESVDDLNVQVHFFTEGDTGALVNVAGAGLVGAQADGDGQLFIDYLLSQDGQEYFRDQTQEYPLVIGIEPSDGLPALDTLEVPDVDLNDLADLETTIAMIAEAGLV